MTPSEPPPIRALIAFVRMYRDDKIAGGQPEGARYFSALLTVLERAEASEPEQFSDQERRVRNFGEGVPLAVPPVGIEPERQTTTDVDAQDRKDRDNGCP